MGCQDSLVTKIRVRYGDPRNIRKGVCSRGSVAYNGRVREVLVEHAEHQHGIPYQYIFLNEDAIFHSGSKLFVHSQYSK